MRFVLEERFDGLDLSGLASSYWIDGAWSMIMRVRGVCLCVCSQVVKSCYN